MNVTRVRTLRHLLDGLISYFVLRFGMVSHTVVGDIEVLLALEER